MKRARVPWRRDYPSTPAVEAARFQDVPEPYPRHWRAFPEPWPPGASIDPETATGLADAFVAADLGLDRGQERAIRNRARALLRERLAHLIRGGRR